MMIHAIVANEKRKSAVRVNLGPQACRINMLKYTSIAAIFAVLLSIVACDQKSNAEKETKVEPANVEIFRIEPQTIVNTYTASAILEGKEEALVTASIAGEIKKFYVDKGAHIKQGDRLAMIDPADYRLAVKKAEAVVEAKQLDFNRKKDLLEREAVSQAKYDAAETELKIAETSIEQARLNMERTVVTSPISGQVSDRFGMIGKRVAPGERLFRIVNTDSLKMNIALSDKEVVHLHNNDRVEVEVDAWPGERFSGRIKSVGISPDANTASFPIEIELKGDARLKPGMVARVTLKGKVLEGLILAPMEAVVERLGSYYVFLYDNGYARLRRITPGKRYGELTEITDGLQAGDMIIRVFGPRMKNGSPVNAVNIGGAPRDM